MHAFVLLLAILSSNDLTENRAAGSLLAAALAERPAAGAPISFELTATVYQLHQSPRPEPPFLETGLQQSIFAIPAEGRFVQETTSVWPNFTSQRTTDVSRSEVLTLEHSRKTHQTSAAGVERTVSRIVRQHPDLLLHAASANRASLRLAGPSSFRFAGRDGTTYLVVLERARVVATEWLSYDDVFGDMITRTEWTWENGEPAAVRQLLNGRVVVTGRYANVRRGSEAVIPTVAVPAEYTEAAVPPAAPVTFVELGSGVELIRNAAGADYHSLLVRLRDRIVVVEGPWSPAAARNTIAAIRARYPSLPISDLVVTHHHDDHSGGIRAYAEAGARIVTTAGNVEYLCAMLSAPHTIEPAPAVAGRVVAIESGHRFADEANELVLLDAGPTDHAAEIIVAWLPRAGVIFQGDLFRHDPASLEPARDSAVRLAKVLVTKKLAVKTIAGVHGEPASPADLDAAIARRDQARGAR